MIEIIIKDSNANLEGIPNLERIRIMMWVIWITRDNHQQPADLSPLLKTQDQPVMSVRQRDIIERIAQGYEHQP